MTPSFQKGKRYALSLLARKAYFSSELKDKLLAKELPSDTVDEIISYCQQQGFLDDEAHLKRWVEKEVRKGKSHLAIRYKLAQKKKLKLAPSILGSSDEEALDCWLKKRASKLQRATQQDRLKLAQRLFRQGFDWDLIKSKVF